MELVNLGVMKLDEAEHLSIKLKKRNIEIVLNHNGHTCTRGCSVTVEVLARKEDLEIVKSVFMEDIYRSLEGHKIDWEALSATYDPNELMATCPACSYQFSTNLKECPDCGLRLA